ncbi:linoleate 9S-lipoxygenase 5-like [Papaver somniferum]|uniref:linoleate 9S-lipoxygenase 5-like n=1 Tax=Papaver somniferum TaxID=3469 RepID=UPI000E6F5263|nr:linoleate 9S-lipoxygenase 5-like [Papaver somniferum]
MNVKFQRLEKCDPNYETRLFILNLNIYIPRDEKFSQLKFSDFIAYAVKALGHVVRPEIKAMFDKTPNEFDSFDDVLHLYEGYQGQEVNQTGDSHLLTSNWSLNLEFVKELFRSDGENPLKFPFLLHY